MAFQIQHVYTRMFCSKRQTHRMFSEDWRPEVKLNHPVRHLPQWRMTFTPEVVLRVTVTASTGKKPRSCAKFNRPVIAISGIEVLQMAHYWAHTARTFCSRLMLAGKCITKLVSWFPATNLAPVNFDALFMNYCSSRWREREHQDA